MKPFNKNEAEKRGYKQLSAKEIENQIIGKQFFGTYLGGFQYLLSINREGSLEGKNDQAHYDLGSWLIDSEKGTMSVMWNFGWFDMTTHFLQKGDDIQMYDVESGDWRSSIKSIEIHVQNIKEYEFTE